MKPNQSAYILKKWSKILTEEYIKEIIKKKDNNEEIEKLVNGLLEEQEILFNEIAKMKILEKKQSSVKNEIKKGKEIKIKKYIKKEKNEDTNIYSVMIIPWGR